MRTEQPDDSRKQPVPAPDTVAQNQQSTPSVTDRPVPVPPDQTEAGHDTNLPRSDSPESLDDDIRQGADREHIDPQHSITRVDKPVNGPGNDASYPEIDNDDVTEEGESLVRKQPQDVQTPYSQPTDPIADPASGLDVRTQSERLDDTHPSTDSNIDSHALYDAGIAGAAGASEPNAGDSVVDYDRRNRSDGNGRRQDGKS